MTPELNNNANVEIADNYDAIIVGASIAGCICALNLANKHWRVAVLEQRSDPNHYKRICTHIIHPSGVKRLQALGLTDPDRTPSMQATAMRIRHRDQVAYFPFGGAPTAANIERKDIDPALKNLLVRHPNITLLTGHKLTGLIQTRQRVTGVQCKHQEGNLDLKAALVIGADGRHSETAKLARAKEYIQDNGRVALFGYFERDSTDSASASDSDSRVWALDSGDEYIGYFPNRNRVLVSWYISESKYKDLPKPAENAISEAIDFIAIQGIKLGQRLEAIATAKQTSPIRTSASLQGLALTGDAKLAADPLTGVGCSWAISSADLLSRCLPSLNEAEIGAPLNSSDKAVETPERIRPGTINRRLKLYHCLHSLKYRLPSFLMTFMSMHGKWVYQKQVFGIFSALSSRRKRAP